MSVRLLLATISITALAIGVLKPSEAAYAAGCSGITDPSGVYDISKGCVGLDNNPAGKAILVGTITTSNPGGFIQVLSATSFGFLTNQGLITLSPNNATGIDVQGRLNSLVNEGAIVGGITGMSVGTGGSIGHYTNSGVISGVSAGISNAGSITDLTNSGVNLGLIGLSNVMSGKITSFNNSGSISGGATAINNAGSVGTLVNSGAIRGIYAIRNTIGGTVGTIVNSGTLNGNSYAVANLGTIDTLVNSGRISGTSNAIRNDKVTIAPGVIASGTISLLVNDGTILSSTAGISNNGIMGNITNNGLISGNVAITSSGVIIGDIDNQGTIRGSIISANDLVINGGRGSVFGTLTGAGISIAGATPQLTFNQGNVFLDEKIINATVTNHATALQINQPITIRGDYTQDNSKLIIGGGGNQIGQLMISGTANISNTPISFVPGLNRGVYTIVAANTGSAYDDIPNQKVIEGGYSYSFTVVTDGTTNKNLVVTLDRLGTPSNLTAKLLGSLSMTNGSMRQISQHIDDVLNPDLNQDNQLTNANAERLGLLDQKNHTVSIGGLNALGQARGGGGALALNDDPSIGVVKKSISKTRPNSIAAWMTPFGGVNSQSGQSDDPGYNGYYYGLVGGVDKIINESIMVGVGLSWTHNHLSNSDAAYSNQLDTNSYQGFLYTSYQVANFYMMLIGGGSYDRYEHKKQDNLAQYSGKYQGYQAVGRGEMGLDFQSPWGMIFTPFTDLSANYGKAGAYHESGDSRAEDVDAVALSSLLQGVGLKAGGTKATKIGLLSMVVKGEGLHNWLHSPTNIVSQVSGEPIITEKVGRAGINGVRLSADVDLQFKNNLAIGVSYENTRLFYNYNDHLFTVRVAKKF